LEKSTLILEDTGLPAMLPTAEDSEAAGKEVEGPEKEQELGIGQVLERLEEVTNMLTSR
jgi:hypothetical protein